MRLCFISDPNSVHTRRLMRYFVEREHDVYLIFVNTSRYPLPPKVTIYDLAARISARKLRYLVWGPTVRRIVRTIQPDILHAHQVANAGWLGAASGYHPLVVTAWGSDLLVGPKRSRVQRRLARWVLKSADYVTCVSQSLAQAAQLLGADPNRLEVAPWGIDTEIFHPATASEKQALYARFDLKPGPVVLSTRKVWPIYNPFDIAHAIPRVLEQIPKTQFVIRTYKCDQTLMAQFREIIEGHQVTRAVRYIGELPDDDAVADLYRVSDVALSVPSSDGTPSSVLEALACGAVPVLSDVPSLREWVRDGWEGLFVPIGDVAEIGAAIVRLLSDEEDLETFRRNGLKLIRQRADSRVWMRRNEEIYRRLVERTFQ